MQEKAHAGKARPDPAPRLGQQPGEAEHHRQLQDGLQEEDGAHGAAVAAEMLDDLELKRIEQVVADEDQAGGQQDEAHVGVGPQERLAFLLGSLLGSLLGGGLWLRFRGREAGGRGLEAEGQDRNK